MYKANVLLSSYNGAKFIEEQIKSILAQEGVEVRIVVRDDGSADETMDIVRRLAEADPRISILESDSPNMGPGKSFMTLLRDRFEEGSAYYAFADQDDIWLEDKLISGIEQIKDIGLPALYSSNQFLYINGENKGKRFDFIPDMTVAGHITRNLPSGCTYIFNNALAKAVCDAPLVPDDVLTTRLHDSWLMLVALCIGKAVYDDTPHILYRIHEDNTVGVKKMGLKDNLKLKYKRLTDKRYSRYRSKTARALLELYPGISGRNKELLSEVAYYKEDKAMRKALRADSEFISKAGKNIPLKIFFGLI
ncbi:MAG: glycosyltransferase [Saccharofermentans sp.]|nr:glycosyltransferase [Saccharofermentans sp.]